MNALQKEILSVNSQLQQQKLVMDESKTFVKTELKLAQKLIKLHGKQDYEVGLGSVRSTLRGFIDQSINQPP